MMMRIKLHNCLKQLLREVILTPEENIQLVNLKKVFAWYMTKLEGFGEVNAEEKMKARALLYPDLIKKEAQAKQDAKMMKS